MLSKPRNAPFTARMGFDPSATDVGVQIIDYPTVITARVNAIEIASGVWESDLEAPSTAGSYALLWDANGADWRAEDLTVTSTLYSEGEAPPVVSTDDTPLLTVDQYKRFANIAPSETGYDIQIEEMIGMVTAAIRSLTDRDFGAAPVLTTRTYDYTGGGVVNIDDASSIVSVSLDGDGLVDGDFVAQPRNDAVQFYLELFVQPGYANQSPEMLFTRNVNGSVYGMSRTRAQSTVEVEALFGWADVPKDVTMAALLMVQSALELPADEVQSESIAEYSYAQADSSVDFDRWPRKAADLLRPYRRINM